VPGVARGSFETLFKKMSIFEEEILNLKEKFIF